MTKVSGRRYRDHRRDDFRALSMRVIFAILISLLLIGGTFAYTKFAASVRPEPLQVKENFAKESYRIQVLRTFDSEGDADFDVPSLTVLFRGEKVFESADFLPSAKIIEVNDLEKVVVEGNEVFVTANVKTDDDDWDSDATSQHAMRVIVFEGDTKIADGSFWLESGSDSVSGVVSFRAKTDVPDHDH